MANILNWRKQISFSTGDTIRVHQTVVEGKKTRTQIFEGLVVRIRGHQGLKSFTVRKIATGAIGVERIYPENSPTVTKIEIKKRGKVRRAVLSYLRTRVGKKASKVKDMFVKGNVASAENEALVVAATEVEETEGGEKQPPKKTSEGVADDSKSAAKKEARERRKAKKKKKIVRKERVMVR